ncbi:MAG: FAD-dependent oxidoreductase [archaeon]
MQQLMKIDKITRETHDTVTLTLKGRQKMDFRPGQFIMIELQGKEKTPKRAYSLSSSPTKDFLEITVKEMPNGWISKIVNNGMKIGEEISVTGPYGNFVFDPEQMKEIVLLAAGSGIAPFRCFCQYIIDKKLPTKVTFVYSNKAERDIIFKGQIRDFAKKIKGLELILTLTREEKKGFRHGRIDDAFVKGIVSKNVGANYFICGPPEMVNATKGLLQANGVQKECIKAEVYG